MKMRENHNLSHENKTRVKKDGSKTSALLLLNNLITI
jgi:hypothetical protein